ncbi:MAG: hypothetical protein ABI388_12275 [Bacteroidia bacterium]
MRSKNLQQALESERKQLSQQEKLLQDAERILFKSRLSDKNILDNLKFYNKSFEFLDDDDEIETEKIFTALQLKSICKKLRLRFLPSQFYQEEIPYEAVLKIKDLNIKYRKDIKHFKILSASSFFAENKKQHQAMLFAQTIYGNYYLIHAWGKPLNKWRSILFFSARNFESLFISILLFSLTEALLLPNNIISTDERADYFSLYRMACIFHLLILNAGFTIFILFSSRFTFSESNWDVEPLKNRSVY